MQQPRPALKRLRDWLLGSLVSGLVSLLRRRSRDSRKSFAIRIANLIFALAGKTRRRSVRNLANAFPFMSQRETELLAITAYRNIVFGVMECFWLDQIPYSIHCSDSARKLLSSGQAAVVATLHMSCYELVPFAVQQLTSRSVTLSKIPTFVRNGKAMYEGVGINCIDKHETGAFLTLIDALKSGSVVSLHSDHYSTDTPVRFFGQSTRAPSGAAMLSAVTRAPILLAYAVMDKQNRYQVYFESLTESGIPTDPNAVHLTVRQIYQRFEQIIIRYPDQWYWSYNRWRED